MQPSVGSRDTSPGPQEPTGGGEPNNDDDSGAGRIVPTLRIGVDGKIVVDEDRFV